MAYTVITMPRAQKYLDKLSKSDIIKVNAHIPELEADPYQPRLLLDTIKLKGYRSPPMYRLRVGRHRLEYFVVEADKTVYITNAFPRSGDSDYK